MNAYLLALYFTNIASGGAVVGRQILNEASSLLLFLCPAGSACNNNVYKCVRSSGTE